MLRVFCPPLLLFAVVCISCNCSKSRPHSGPQRDASLLPVDGGSVATKATPFHCSPATGGEAFTLGSTDGADEDDDSGLDVPFAINVGDGLAFDGGYAVTAIDGRAGRSQALLATMTADAHQGRKLDLGRVFGDADPPRLAGNAERLVLAIADMDAGGRMLRLARVDSPLKQPSLTRGGEISVLGNPSTVFSLAVNADRGVLVWDQQQAHSENTEIAGATFSVQSLSPPAKPTVFSNRLANADSPHVLTRAGGYWLAWVQAGPEKKPASKQAAPNPAPKTNRSEPEDHLDLVDLGTRELRALQLDTAGNPLGKPLRIADGVSHVVAYDMNLLDDGAALFAWRDDDTTPGVESQIVHLARAGLDGHVDFYRIEDEAIGVGAPQLLIDTSAPAEDRAWLALINTGERTSVVKLLPNGKPTGLVVGDAELGIANPLLRHQGRLLLVRQRGRGVDMEAIHCTLDVQGPAR